MERQGIDERFVWWLWQTRRFDGTAARTAGHEVIFPGWFSTAAGPDYRDAIIADRAGNLRRGDIEIHVVDSSWRDHGHDRDPAYDCVILHVVLWRDSVASTTTSAGITVPLLELGPLLETTTADLRALFHDWQPELVGCPVNVPEPDSLLQTIRESGSRRFGAKVQRMAANVEAVGADEAIYRLLPESLGYSANRRPFRKLAEALPFGLMSSLTTFQAEELLLAAAGLIESDDLLSAYIDGPVLGPSDLVNFRVRPSNTPTARLRGLARLVSTHRLGLASTISDTRVEDLWKLFVVEADTVLIGRGRADDMVVNVALPYLTAYRSLDGVAALDWLRAPSGNRWVDALHRRLSGSGLVIRPYRAIHQQGLLDLSLRFCRYDHCEACPLHRDRTEDTER